MITKHKYGFLNSAASMKESGPASVQPIIEPLASSRSLSTASPLSDANKEDILYCNEELAVPNATLGKRNVGHEPPSGEKRKRYEETKNGKKGY